MVRWEWGMEVLWDTDQWVWDLTDIWVDQWDLEGQWDPVDQWDLADLWEDQWVTAQWDQWDQGVQWGTTWEWDLTDLCLCPQ